MSDEKAPTDKGHALSEAAFLRHLLEVIHPAGGMLEPMTEEQANAEQQIIDRIHVLECEVETPSSLLSTLEEIAKRLDRFGWRDAAHEVRGMSDLATAKV